MKLNISIEDLNEVIRAVAQDRLLEPHEIEKILVPIREQLGIHLKWDKRIIGRVHAVWDYVNGGYKAEKDVIDDIYATECPYKLEPQEEAVAGPDQLKDTPPSNEDLHVINSWIDVDGVKHTKEYFTGIDRNRPMSFKDHIE